MGSSKHRHSKDKLYILPSELARTQAPTVTNRPAELVPLDSCFLSLVPFTNPLCTIEGHIFDHDKIKDFVSKYGRNPVTGEILSMDDLFPLHFTKDESGFFQCPLSLKRFTSGSHIVAVRTSGNVYGYSTLKQVASKQSDGSMSDPLSGIKFTKSDLVTIQDPHNTDLRTIANFKHVNSTYFKAQKSDNEIKGNHIYSAVMSKMVERPELVDKHAKIFKNDHSGAPDRPKHELFTTGSQASSFTSTAVNPSYRVEYRNKTVFEVRLPLYEYVKKRKQKGYVKLTTSDGDLNVMLHADRVPVACDNFLQHCEDGYYDNTEFFRCVPDFMIQGGDPTNTGRGGESAFYTRAQRDGISESVPKYFRDEFDNTLFHVGMGVLSMANKGKHTNSSQFFITFNTCSHLDNVHTVFGKVVGGLDVLKRWNSLKVDDEERPLKPPRLLATVVYSNPFEDARKALDKEREEQLLEERKRTNKNTKKWLFDASSSEASDSKRAKLNEVGYLIKK
ncbi:peptidyl-prolyl cis-trans isomerase [Theileria orientalis]|uniref:Peptidyl-prolyl cis-trans isomerase n=1 Tax=Theileria orientalis TaxID=68886 RepID=A0A976QVI5_THEOR|nr:peptidyl-prolyl cis-trans isomerase [Theileria orientalis]